MVGVVVIDGVEYPIESMHLSVQERDRSDRDWMFVSRIEATGTLACTYKDQDLLNALMGVKYDHPIKRELLWMVHNLIAHPLSEITYWLGFLLLPVRDFGNWFHDITVPRHAPNTGRG